MKKKKADEVNSEKNRLLYFETGMIVTLSLVLFAFEYANSPDAGKQGNGRLMAADEFFVIEQTFREEKAPEKEKPKVTLIINPVDDKNILIGEPNFPNPEIGANDPFDVWAIPTGVGEEIDDPIDFVLVEDKPRFNGGDPLVEFRSYIAKHLIYPEEARDNGVDGRVVVEFIVDKTGKVTGVKVLQGAHPVLNGEAVRVIESSPLWTPGKQRGKPVLVRYFFPVVFKLAN